VEFVGNVAQLDHRRHLENVQMCYEHVNDGRCRDGAWRRASSKGEQRDTETPTLTLAGRAQPVGKVSENEKGPASLQALLND
jgi:hypothetical protein